MKKGKAEMKTKTESRHTSRQLDAAVGFLVNLARNSRGPSVNFLADAVCHGRHKMVVAAGKILPLPSHVQNQADHSWFSFHKLKPES